MRYVFVDCIHFLGLRPTVSLLGKERVVGSSFRAEFNTEKCEKNLRKWFSLTWVHIIVIIILKIKVYVLIYTVRVLLCYTALFFTLFSHRARKEYMTGMSRLRVRLFHSQKYLTDLRVV